MVSPLYIISLILIIIICLILLYIFVNQRAKEKFLVNYPLNFGGFYSNLPKFYNNCDGDHKLVVELFEGDYTLNDLSQYGFFNSTDGLACVNVTSGFSVILYDNDNFQGNKIVLYPSGKNYLYGNNFNLKIRSLRIRTLPLFFMWCFGLEMLFSLKAGKYTLNDLNQLLSGKALQIRSFYIPSGFNVKFFRNDNFNDLVINVNGPNYSHCIKKNENVDQSISSIIVEDLVLESL